MAYEISLSVLTQKISDAIVEAIRAGVPPEIAVEALAAARQSVANAMPLITAASEGVRRQEGTPT